jgi:hypothetical protein
MCEGSHGSQAILNIKDASGNTGTEYWRQLIRRNPDKTQCTAQIPLVVTSSMTAVIAKTRHRVVLPNTKVVPW